MSPRRSRRLPGRQKYRSGCASSVPDREPQRSRATALRSLRRLAVGHVAAAVAADAEIGLLGVGDKAFEHAQPRAIFADHGAGLVGENFLIGAGFEELADPQPAGIARRLLGR